MAVVVGVANILEVGIWCQDSEQASVNVLHYLCTGVTGAATTDFDVAKGFGTGYAALYAALLYNGASFRGPTVRVINITPLPIAQIYALSATAGTAGAVGMSRQSAGLISKYSNVAGRKGRGRLYAPFPSVSDDQGLGVPTAGYLTRLNNLAVALLANVTITNGASTGTAVLTPVIYNRVAKTTIQITSDVTRTVWATQRRRGSYGRPNTSPV